jgi:anti-anti-sigma factor
VVHAHPEDVASSGRPEPRGSRPVAVEAVVDADGTLVCSVRDDGRWHAPAERAEGNLGLGMVRGMVDDLRIDAGNAGTTAVFRHRLTRTPSLYTAVPHPAHEPPSRPGGLRLVVDGHRVSVIGTVDLTTADRLRHVLYRTGAAGAEPLVVDLSGVTFLGSPGVRVLYDLVRHDSAVTLLAPIGSVAQHVLELVRLPYLNRLPDGA